MTPIGLFNEISSVLKTRVAVLIWVVTIVLFAIGFGFKTPAAKFQDLESRITSSDSTTHARLIAHDHQLAELERGQQNQKELIEAIIRLSCYKENVRLIDLAGLPCERLLVGQQTVGDRIRSRAP